MRGRHDQNARSKLGISSKRDVPIIGAKALLRLAEWVETQLASYGGEPCKTAELSPPAQRETGIAADGDNAVGNDQGDKPAEGFDGSAANADQPCGVRRNGGAT